MKTIELNVERRSTLGKNEARRERAKGKIPAVVYGSKKPTVPIHVDRTRFETWELWYPDGDDEYLDKVGTHWERLKGVVTEDVEIYQEWAAARRSTAYTRNVFNNRECKITHFHRVVQDMLDASD